MKLRILIYIKIFSMLQTYKPALLTLTLLNFLNGIIQLPFLELSIIIFKDIKMRTWSWPANSTEPGQTAGLQTQEQGQATDLENFNFNLDLWESYKSGSCSWHIISKYVQAQWSLGEDTCDTHTFTLLTTIGNFRLKQEHCIWY